MSKPTIQPGDSRVLAAFHAVGGSWHVVVARLEPQRATFVAAKTFGPSEVSGIDAWLASHNVGRVVGVLPGSSIICRTCNLPNGSPAQLESALRLQAETQLLGSVPAHRLATAVLHASEGESSRSGVIVGWPESANAPKPPVAQHATYAPVIASLAALLNGSRPDEPIMLIDRQDGSLALSLTHANGAIFRAARLDTSTEEARTKSIQRSVTETALSVGHTGQFIDETTTRIRRALESAPNHDAVLLLPRSMPAELAARLHGAPATSEWWNTFGIAAGAALAASDQLAPLTQMLRQPTATKPSRFRELSVRLSDRATAMKLLAACLAIFVFAPVVFSGMRLLILTIRYPNLEERLEEIESSTQKLAMYGDLKNHAWSMTKVLADLVSSAPEGIELESIAVDHGKELRIKGITRDHGDASALDAVQTMQANMQQFNVFKDIRPSYDSPNAMGTSYEFSLIARVNDAHVAPTYPEELDFAKMTLAERKYGKQPDPGATQPEVRNTELATRPAEEQPATPELTGPVDETLQEQPERAAVEEQPDDGALALNEPSRGGRRPLGNDRTGTAGDTSTRGDTGDVPVISRVPEPLSAAQIAAMSVAEVRDAMANVAEAMKRGTGMDAEVRDRLQNEFRMLRDRLREIE